MKTGGSWRVLFLAGCGSLLLLLARGAEAPSGPDDPSLKLRPPRPEIPPSFWEQHGSWVILGSALLLGVAILAVWWLRRPKPPVVVAPDAVARQELEPLRRQPESGRVLSQVSQALRHYFSRAFGLAPGETTTADFCRELAAREEVGAELAGPVTQFLRRCDEYKFAPPTPRPALDAATQALRFIDQAETRRAAVKQAEEIAATKRREETQQGSGS